MLGDSRLLLAGSIGASGVITPLSFVTNPITAGTKILAPYVIEIAHQNANGLNSNAGIDIGQGSNIFLHWEFMPDQNGANVNNVASLTDFTIDLFTTSVAPASIVAPVASTASSMLLATTHANDGVNFAKNYTSGSEGFLAIPMIPNYMGFQYLGAQFTSAGAGITTGAILIELVLGTNGAKGHAYKSGFAIT